MNKFAGEDEHLHHCVAAFISDVAPVGTPIAANAAAGFRLGMAASLDHSMWIHRPNFRIDEDWMLYETESTVAGRLLLPFIEAMLSLCVVIFHDFQLLVEP